MGYFDQFEEYPQVNKPDNSNSDYFNQFEEYPSNDASSSSNNSLAQPSVTTQQNNISIQPNPTTVQEPVNKKQTPIRDAGVKIGRALMPKGMENWWYGAQDDQQMLEQGDANIPTREQNQELYNSGQITKEQFIKNLQDRTNYDNALADKEYRDVRNANIGKGAFDIGTAALPIGLSGQFLKGGVALAKAGRAAKIASKLNDVQKVKYAKQIQKLAQKQLMNDWKIKTGASIADGTTIGAGFGAFNNVYDNVTGLQNEMSLPEEIAQGALIGAGFGTGIPIIGGILKKIAGTKAAQNIGNTFAEKFPNFTGSLANVLNLEIKNPLAKKYKGLDKLIAKGNSPVEKRLSNEAKAELQNAEGITPSENKQIINDLEYGLTEQREPAKHSTTTMTDEEATKWWNELAERENAEAQAKAEKEAADKAEYNAKMQKMQKAWEEQVQKEAEQHRQETDNFKFPEERVEQEQPNVKPWNTDSLPHLTQEEAEQANLRAQQNKWNEKRNAEKENNANVQEASYDDFDNQMMNKYHLFPEEYDKLVKDYEEFSKYAGDNAPSFEDYVKASKNTQSKEFISENSNSSEGDLSPVKSETDINTPTDTKTLENEHSINPQNEDMKYDFANVKGQSVKHGIKSSLEYPTVKQDESMVTRLEGGVAEGVEEGNKDLYTLRTRPERNTNSLDSDNYITESPQEQIANDIKYNEKGGEVDLKEWNRDLAPEDSWNLNKEIENYKPSDKLKSSKQAGTFINKKAKDVLGVNDLLTRTKSPAITKALQVPFKRNGAKLFIKQLCGMKQSKQTKTALENLYFHADNELRSFINNEAKKNNLPYEFTNQVYIKGKAGEQKAISNNKSVIDKKAEHFNERRAVDKNTGINPYYGDAPAENTLRDAKTWREVNVENNNSAINNTVAKKMADAIAQGRNAIPEKIKGLKAKTIDIIKYSKVYKEGSKLLELAKKYLGDIETEYVELSDGFRGVYDEITNGIKLNSNETSVFTHDHEVAHVIFNRYLDDSMNNWLNFKNNSDRINLVQAMNKAYEIYKNNKRLIDAICEYKESVNNPYLTAGDLKNKIPQKAYEIYREYEKEFLKYKNSMNEQFADCVSKGYFDGTPDEFIEIYDKIKPEFNKLVEEGKLYGTEQELQELIRDEFRRTASYGDSEYGHNVVEGNQQGIIQKNEKSRNVGNNEHSGAEDAPRDRRGSLANESRGERSEGSEDSGRNKQYEVLDERYDEHGNLKKGIKFFDISKDSSSILPKAPKVLNEKSQQNRAYRAKLSKLGEDIAVDMGWLTPEQANNRIKQQTLFGKGFYVKQVSDKKDPFIDLYKNPMEGRNKKEGIWGRNTSDNISHNESAKESTYAQLKETTDRLHTKNVFDYIEKEFARNIPYDNRIPEGYVPVSRTLLSAAYFQRLSKDWYRTVTGGEEAIRKAFKDKKMADSWVEIANRANKEDYMIPKSVFNKLFTGAGEKPSEYIERYCKGRGTTGALKAAAKIAGFTTDYINERFKRGVLTSMSFFVNNRISNQQLIAAATEHPTDYLKSFVDMWKIDRKALSKDNVLHSNRSMLDVMTGMVKNPVKFAKDICEAYAQEFSKIPSELVDSSIVEAFEHANANRIRSGYKPLDNLLNLLDGNIIDTKRVEGIGNKASASAGNICFGLPNKLFFKLSDEFMKVNTAFENLERKQLMSIQMNKTRRELLEKTGRKMIATKELMEYVDKHPELMSATVKDVEDIIGDYNNFNNFEKRVLKRAIPFYAWFRTITRNSVMMAKKYPTRFALILSEMEHLKERDEDLKEYQRGSIRTGIKDERSGKELLVNKFAQGIPWATFEELVDDTQNSKGVGNFSNAYKIPAEAIMGKHFFREGEITNKRYVRYDTNAFNKGKEPNYKYLDTKTGKTIDTLPASTRAGYIGKEALKVAYPAFQSRMVSPAGVLQGIKNLKEKGEFLEPDKHYDADLGGFYNKEYAGTIKKSNGKNKKLTRFATSDYSEKVKLLNRFGGMSIQNKQPLNKKEKQEQKEKYKNQRKRMRGN